MLKEKYATENGSIFRKLALGLVLMFMLIVLIFWWIYRLNVEDIQRELEKNKLGEVRFMSSQLSNQFEQVLMNALTLSEDQSVRGYTYVLHYGNDFAKYKAKLELIEKLALNSASTSWNNTIILYYPDQKDTVSSDPQFFLPIILHVSRSARSMDTTYEQGWHRLLFTSHQGTSRADVYRDQDFIRRIAKNDV